MPDAFPTKSANCVPASPDCHSEVTWLPQNRSMRHSIWLPVFGLFAAGCANGPAVKPPTESAATAGFAVRPIAETAPVASADDAADDPAIWVHPEDPDRSLVIGTDKRRGLEIYDLNGRLLQVLPDGRLNNVDLRNGFEVAGREYALVAATNRTNRSVALYLLDPATSRVQATGDPVPTGFADPYGLCMYRNPAGEFFVFANEADSGL